MTPRSFGMVRALSCILVAAIATIVRVFWTLSVLSNALRVVYGGLTPPIAFSRLAEEIEAEYARLSRPPDERES